MKARKPMSARSSLAVPGPAVATPEIAPVSDAALLALRAELDGIDSQLLALIEQRQGVAARIGALKQAAASGLKLRPDREAAVLRRVAESVAEPNRRFAQALWREIMGAGLVAQGPLEVTVWAGARRDAGVLARGRFGGVADYRDVATPADALAAADADGVAVLALDPDTAWWEDLPERSDLWIFEALGRRGAADPAVLMVGRLAPGLLARGVSYRVSAGGDSGWDGRAEKLISAGRGRRLYAVLDNGEGPLDRAHGLVGAAPLG
jgi:chorismate mutase